MKEERNTIEQIIYTYECKCFKNGTSEPNTSRFHSAESIIKNHEEMCNSDFKCDLYDPSSTVHLHYSVKEIKLCNKKNRWKKYLKDHPIQILCPNGHNASFEIDVIWDDPDECTLKCNNSECEFGKVWTYLDLEDIFN